MIASIRHPEAKLLCTLAQDDESTLTLPLPDQIFGFHAQQSCEKFLKALIAAHNRPYPFVHDLKELRDELLLVHEELPATPYDLVKLTHYGVRLRYALGVPLSGSERDAMRQTVIIIHTHVFARILQLETASIA